VWGPFTIVGCVLRGLGGVLTGFEGLGRATPQVSLFLCLESLLQYCDLTVASACGIILFASVVELVDTADSKSAAARLEGSTPFTRISIAYVSAL
jgi:hypothetical protein